VCIKSSAQDSTSLPVKVRHAEPLYIDLIRDLGARKGEKEWNAGWVTENQDNYSSHTGFVEYEFSPVNRLGLEVEVPIKFYHVYSAGNEESTEHRNRIEGIKTAAQFTFLASEKHQLSLAAGYIHEVRLHSFQTVEQTHSLIKGHGFNPFVVAAKRFGQRFHTLLYMGPRWENTIHEGTELTYQVNTSIHYMLPSKHFVGIEINEEYSKHHATIIARPQVKIVMSSNFALGFATGIPVHAADHGLNFLMRMIYEP
jgi:hypothetical protein